MIVPAYPSIPRLAWQGAFVNMPPRPLALLPKPFHPPLRLLNPLSHPARPRYISQGTPKPDNSDQNRGGPSRRDILAFYLLIGFVGMTLSTLSAPPFETHRVTPDRPPSNDSLPSGSRQFDDKGQPTSTDRQTDVVYSDL